MNLLADGTPRSKLKCGMVGKLVTAAAAAIAENVILVTENTRLRKRAMTAEEKQKSKSRKHLSKGRVISAEVVVRLKLAAVAKKQLLTEKTARMLEKKRAKDTKVLARSVRGRSKGILVIIDDEIQSSDSSESFDSSDSTDSSETSDTIYLARDRTILAVLATLASSRTRAGRAHAAAMGRGGGSS
ncbi:hypothetical protein Q9L58_010463 [Maublancomyces gigas]|uniref:Uncharacterized protein n=1 Tax=Discina gigas TaxID=1032678 RepID=A0ABR3G433_9PEZI